MFISALIAALLVPLAAHAQAPKQVEVINDPLVVEVTNLPPVQDVNIVDGATGGCEVKTFQLVGFTSTLYTGNLGGIFGSTQKCQLDFPGSRMCAFEEIQKTTDVPDQIADFAWMEPASTTSCVGSIIIDESEKGMRQWSCNALDAPCRAVAVQEFGISFESTGSTGGLRLPCSVEQPIACCALAP
jgi:hypothetical protein